MRRIRLYLFAVGMSGRAGAETAEGLHALGGLELPKLALGLRRETELWATDAPRDLEVRC